MEKGIERKNRKTNRNKEVGRTEKEADRMPGSWGGREKENIKRGNPHRMKQRR